MATDMARRMVTEWGMSEKLGMIAYGDNSQELFLGHSVTQNKNVSEADGTARSTARSRRSSITAYAEAKTHPDRAPDDLHSSGAGLLEYETLSGEEIRTVLRGEPVIKAVVDDPAPETRRASVPTTGKAAPLPPNLGAAPAPG